MSDEKPTYTNDLRSHPIRCPRVGCRRKLIFVDADGGAYPLGKEGGLWYQESHFCQDHGQFFLLTDYDGRKVSV